MGLPASPSIGGNHRGMKVPFPAVQGRRERTPTLLHLPGSWSDPAGSEHEHVHVLDPPPRKSVRNPTRPRRYNRPPLAPLRPPSTHP
jgi:hypothetical protein